MHSGGVREHGDFGLGHETDCCDVRPKSVVGGKADVRPTSAFVRS